MEKHRAPGLLMHRSYVLHKKVLFKAVEQTEVSMEGASLGRFEVCMVS